METIEYTKFTSDKDGLKWVMLACSKDQTRYNLNMVFSTGRHFIATDGNRLHTVKLRKPVPMGAYKPLRCAKGAIILIPQPDVEMPDFYNIYKQFGRDFAMKKNEGKKFSVYGKEIEHKFAYFIKGQDAIVNWKYFSDMVSGGGEFISRSIGTDRPVYFKNRTRGGFIMPIRI
jgi:hypothetical protein